MNPYLKQIKDEFLRNSATAPLVSVIVPLYNYQDYIVECIQSVIMQTYKNWQLIIVDDCSTDNAYNIAKEFIGKYPNLPIHLYQNNINSRISATRNNAISKAKGEYIFPLDCDDMLAMNALEEYVLAFQNNPTVDVLNIRSTLFGNKNEVFYIEDPIYYKYTPYYVSIWRLMYKKKVWKHLNGYSSFVDNIEDWDFAARAITNNFSVLPMSQPLHLCRQHDMISSSSNLGNKNNTNLRAKLVLNNKQYYHEFYVRWAEGILAGDKGCWNICNQNYWLPNFLALLGYFEADNWDYIQKELKQKLLPELEKGELITRVPINMPDGSIVDIEYVLEKNLTVGYKATTI